MDTTLEQPTIETTEIAVAEAPKETPAEFSRGQIGKTKRAFAKAGRADASEEVVDRNERGQRRGDEV